MRRLGGSEHTGFLLPGLGAGYLLGAPAIRLLLDRMPPRDLLTGSLTATAAAFFGLFISSSLATALPAAAAVGMFGSMSLVIPQTAMQRGPSSPRPCTLPGPPPRPAWSRWPPPC